VVAGSTGGPVGDFCAALADLQRSSGISRANLARTLSYGRSQLYEILDGRVKRPPEWDRLVEPLVRACLGPGHGDAGRERAIADWRRRHEILVRVHDELLRRSVVAGPAATARRARASQSLLAHTEELWPRLVSHPFVQAVCDGTLDDVAFRRWMVNDHYYNVEYQRFIAGLAAIAPTAAATESIAAGIPGNHIGLDQISRLSTRSFIDVDVEPALVAVGFTSYLHVQVARGYEPALAALYASETVYFETWSKIRPTAKRSTPYWHLIDHWSSEPYAIWLATLGRLLDTAAPDGLGPETYRVFERVVRFELLHFTVMFAGETW
jgi:thiaminase